MPIDASDITRAYLVKSEEESDASKRIVFDFNPLTLSYSLEASTQQQNQPDRTGQQQHVSQFAAKLSFDAVFDNTDIGEDVRGTTLQIAEFLKPSQPAGGATKNSGTGAPALLLFHWGAFRFQGVLTQYKETIDFFSREGVPLRASLSLAMNEQGPLLQPDPNRPTTSTGGSLVPTGTTDSALSVATRGGNPGAARALATANGLGSLRATGGATLQVGAGAGTKASAGLVATAGVNASANWNTSGSGSLFGGQSSAGVAATSGAFAGISTSARTGSSADAGLDPSTMLKGGASADLSVGASASFSVGGAAQMSAGVGLSANVGAKVSWRDLLQFDED
jgi:hypothetical protein